MLNKKGLNVFKKTISPIPNDETEILRIDENFIKDGIDELYLYTDLEKGSLTGVYLKFYLSDGEIVNGDYKWYLLGGGGIGVADEKYVASLSELRNLYTNSNIKAKALKISVLSSGTNTGSSLEVKVVF